MQTFLGLNEKGELQIYVSAFRLNPIGARCERGVELPQYTGINDDNALVKLRAIQEYFDAYASGTLRKGSNIKAKPSSRKATRLKSIRGSTFGKV